MIRRRAARAVVALVRATLVLYPSRFRQRFGPEIVQSAEADLEQSATPAAFAGTSARELSEVISGILPQHRLERAHRRHPGGAPPLRRMLHSIGSDVRQAMRGLRKTPSFTIVAIGVLTLGIGVSTAVFSVVDAVVLRGLPFDEHDRLAVALEYGPNVSSTGQSTTLPTFLDLRREQRSFESLSAVARASLRMDGEGDGPRRVTAMRVTHDFFATLRVSPLLGRPFTEAEELEAAPRVAAISYGFWQRHLNGTPDAIGKTVTLDDQSWEVVAVMPRGFSYPVASSQATEVYVPLRPSGNDAARGRGRSYFWTMIGRLKPGVSIDQAQADLDGIMTSLDQQYPDWTRGSRTRVLSLHHYLVGDVREWMLLLLGSVAVVLLIACANVANLMLARATVRERELGIRAALGAGRWRLTRMLVVEGLILSAGGALAGLALAGLAVEAITASLPANLPRAASIGVDLRIVSAAGIAAVVTGVLFGLLPALQSSRPDITRALRDGGRSLTGGRGSAMRSTLVVAEVALACVLVVGAGLFTASWVQIMRVDTGFDYRGLLTFGVGWDLDAKGMAEARAKGPEAASAFFRSEQRRRLPQLQEILRAIRAVPGITGAAAVNGGVPLTGSYMRVGVTLPEGVVSELPEEVATALNDEESIDLRQVTPDYLDVLGLPLIAGRMLTEEDAAQKVIVINEAAARRYWPGRDALGQQIGVSSTDGMRTVVGIVGNVRHLGPEGGLRQEAYVPLEGATGVALLLRTTGDPLTMLPAVKRAVWSIDAKQVLPERDVTVEGHLDRLIAQRRFSMALLALLGIMALFIAAAGVYGVMAYVVSQRTQEIGVRMALGARPADVVSMVVRRAGLLIAGGLAAGAAAAWMLAAGIQQFLFLVASHDWRVFAASAMVLGAAGLVACAVPARRASRVDPLVALRGN